MLAWHHVGEAAPNESADELLKRSISLATSGQLEDAEQLLTEGKSVYDRDARFPIELAGVAWRKKNPRVQSSICAKVSGLILRSVWISFSAVLSARREICTLP